MVSSVDFSSAAAPATAGAVSTGGSLDSVTSVSMVSSVDFSSLVDGCCFSEVGDSCCAEEEDDAEAGDGDLSPAEELDDAPSVAEDVGGGDVEGPVLKLNLKFDLPESHGPLASSAFNLSSATDGASSSSSAGDKSPSP